MGKYPPLLLVAILALCNADEQKTVKEERVVRRSYVCPPNFMRLSNKCYYFSNKTATWQNAYWKCNDMHSNIATIKNANQDRILRRTLDHDALVPLERWIGGRYDWGTMSWKWAASGRPVQYQGFDDPEDPQNKEALIWHCIIMDPTKHYKWNSRSCTEEKHYVCQTKIRVVTNKGKKKLMKQYKNKLNEVPVPEIHSNDLNVTYDKYTHALKLAAFARRNKETKIRKKNKKDAAFYTQPNTTTEFEKLKKINRKNKNKNRARRYKHRNAKEGRSNLGKMRWKTYYEGTPNPLSPRVAVEEFSYS